MSHPNYEHGIHITTVDQAETQCSKFITSRVTYENLFRYLSNFSILVDRIIDEKIPLNRRLKSDILEILKKCKDIFEPKQETLKANIASWKTNYAEATIGVNKKAVASNKTGLEKERDALIAIKNLYKDVKNKLRPLFRHTEGGGGSAAAKTRRRSRNRRRLTRRSRKYIQ